MYNYKIFVNSWNNNAKSWFVVRLDKILNAFINFFLKYLGDPIYSRIQAFLLHSEKMDLNEIPMFFSTFHGAKNVMISCKMFLKKI